MLKFLKFKPVFFSVAVKGLPDLLTYDASDLGLNPEELPGCFVTVPLRSRFVSGLLVDQVEQPDFSVKKALYPPLKIFKSKTVDVIKKLVQIYPVDLFTVASSLAPPILAWQGLSSLKRIFQQNKGRCESFDAIVSDFIAKRRLEARECVPPKPLTTAQEAVLNSLLELPQSTYLLRGETGSGKTEIYIHLAVESIKNGHGVLILVPEISLTPQMVDRFSAHIPSDKLAVLHSGLTRSERAFEWMSVLSGQKTVVIGTRSAVLAPVQNLKWIIVDEEHDKNFRQNESVFRYDAVRIARLRSEVEGCSLLLGSATPRVETFYLALTGKMKSYYLPPFSSAHSKLQVEVVNMVRAPKASPNLSKRAMAEIQSALDQGKQAIIFYNRVGYCGSLYCSYCGKIKECPNCALALRVIKRREIQYCSVCGHSERIDMVCKICKRNLVFLGAGTERIFEEVSSLFPHASLERLDKETHTNSSDVFKTLNRFSRGEIQILVSTQMITKGHDFKNLSVVVAANPDIGRNIPDFRQFENSYQILHQLAGRAGRGDEPGKLIIQTRFPGDAVFDLIKRKDYETFAKIELENRRMNRYPPFAALLRVLCTSDTSLKDAIEYLQDLKARLSHQQFPAVIFGPSECYFNRLKKAFRAHMLFKFDSEQAMQDSLGYLKTCDTDRRLIFEVDPIELT